MSWGDIAFEADLATSVFGDLVGAPALYAGDVKLGKSTSGHAVMMAAEIHTGYAAEAASDSSGQGRTPRPG
jgi:hypothetical protein